jgi:hypothetical protein
MNFEERLAEAQRTQGMEYLELALITASGPDCQHEWLRAPDSASVVIENLAGTKLTLKFSLNDIEECNEDGDPDFKKAMREAVIAAIKNAGDLSGGDKEVIITSPAIQG